MATHSRTGGRGRKRGTAKEIEPSADVNMIAAGLLHERAVQRGFHLFLAFSAAVAARRCGDHQQERQ